MSIADMPPTSTEIQRFAENVLDDLEVVERAYHHLNFSMPATADLLRAARSAAAAGDRVLLIGGTTLLAEALVRLGFELDIWQFGGSYLTDDMQARVCRRIAPADIDRIEAPDREYRLIILPFVIEAVAEPQALLRGLRRALVPGGRLLLATANQTRLDARLAALRGKPFMPRPEAATLSLSWPALRTVRHYHREEVRTMVRNAGYGVRASRYVSGERAFLEMEPLNLQDYAARKLRQAAGRAISGLRDVLVFELTPRAGDRLPAKTPAEHLTVSVVVSVRHGGDRLRSLLRVLATQTYDRTLYEIIALHDGSNAETSAIIAEVAAAAGCRVRELITGTVEGPAARNEATADARGDIVAHTDDSCTLPEDWIQAAAGWFDADTAVIAGPVFAAEGSEPRYFDVPCGRPDPDDKGISSRTMFPITNVFYRRAVALAVGGFDAARSGAPLGWDTELAWRLERSGWRIRFRDEVYQFRVFAPEGSRSRWLSEQFRRASELPLLMARVPEYREQTLMGGIFASKQSMYFDLALAGGILAITKRRRAAVLLALPWVGSISQRIDVWPVKNWPGSLRTVARIGARQTVWLAGFVWGSVKARRPVL
jgi:glycosyltransferase involved in cell wall biosynthesis